MVNSQDTNKLGEERLKKLAKLKELGINPYPAQEKEEELVEQVIANFRTC